MRAALLIGINEYTNFSEKNLNGCIADVHKMEELLSFNADGTCNFDCRTIANIPGGVLDTTAQVREAIENLFSCNADTALFYFSGHGVLTSAGGYLISSDAEVNNWGISMHDLIAIAEASPIGNKIIILDCCHAGDMGSFKISPTSSVIGDGMTVLASCRGSEFSRENSTGGIFTALVAEALRGGAADLVGHVSPGSIYAFVDGALGPWDQRPIFKTNVSEFISLRKTTPPISLDCLRLITVYFQTPSKEFLLDPTFEYTSDCPDNDHVAIFKNLQKMEGVGLVAPVGEEHMYWAAMNKKACKLTALGEHYWDLTSKGRLK